MDKLKRLGQIQKDIVHLEDLMALCTSAITSKFDTVVTALKLVFYGIFYFVRLSMFKEMNTLEEAIQDEKDIVTSGDSGNDLELPGDWDV